MKQKKTLYIVEREVLAKNFKEAVSARGVVTKISIAAEQYQPEYKPKPVKGFNNGKENT